MTAETPEKPSTEETPKPKPKTKPPLTKAQWARIEALWRAGETTYEELCSKYDRSKTCFEKHFKKKGLKKGQDADKINKKVEEALERQHVTDAQIIAARIRETKEEHYKLAAALGRLTWNEILLCKQEKKPVASALNNLKALNAAIVNLKVVREERFAVLGLDRPDAIDPDQIPELIINELTPEQEAELRAREHTGVESAPTVQSTEAGADGADDEEGDDTVVETS